jgi:hypothetical protein
MDHRVGAMTWPAPTRSDHRAFCDNEGWGLVRDARGGTSGHHALTYELRLHDGRILRTRISHPPDGSTYGANIWSHILRDQLDVAEETFWACARDGVKPDRGEPEAPAETLPADLAHLLVTRLHLSNAEIALMSRDEAFARMQEYWRQPG